MLESVVEARLKKLIKRGWVVLKFRTPGYNGVMDRLLVRPAYAPGPPVFVEIKRPGKEERPLQAGVRDNWRARGVDVRDMCDTIEKVDALIGRLLNESESARYKHVGPGFY